MKTEIEKRLDREEIDCYYYKDYHGLDLVPEEAPPIELQTEGLGGSWTSPAVGGSGKWEEQEPFWRRFPYPGWTAVQQFFVDGDWFVVHQEKDSGTIYVEQSRLDVGEDGGLSYSLERLFRVDDLQTVANIITLAYQGKWDYQVDWLLGNADPPEDVVSMNELVDNLVETAREGRLEIDPSAPDAVWEQMDRTIEGYNRRKGQEDDDG